MCCAGTSH
jgi:hypothetical protein